MTKERFEAIEVSPQCWQVIDTKHNLELAVCSSFEGESDSVEGRARTIAGALNMVETLMKHMRGNA